MIYKGYKYSHFDYLSYSSAKTITVFFLLNDPLVLLLGIKYSREVYYINFLQFPNSCFKNDGMIKR